MKSKSVNEIADSFLEIDMVMRANETKMKKIGSKRIAINFESKDKQARHKLKNPTVKSPANLFLNINVMELGTKR